MEVELDFYGNPKSKGTVCDHHSVEEDVRTRQSDRDASNINLTIKKYNLQPEDFQKLQVGWSGRQLGEFADVTVVPTYAEILATVNRARDAFLEFPPEVRAFYDNDPAKMLDAWQAGRDREIFEDLGLLVRLPDAAAAAKAAREARVSEIADGVRLGSAVKPG